MKSQQAYHSLEISAVLESLQTSMSGVSQQEVFVRQQIYGKNILPKTEGYSAITLLFNQFKNPLIYILFIAISISFLTQHFLDAWIILVITLISVVVGFLQEYKANNALLQLTSLVSYKAKVIRDNQQYIINQEDVVPGDIIILSPGDKIPADCRLIDTQNFEVIESSLTGESMPIEKQSTIIIPQETVLADRKNMVYMGTVVSRGQAKAIVTDTGIHTQIGNIAHLVYTTKEGITPLQKEIFEFGKNIGYIVIILNIIVFFGGIVTGKPLLEMFLISVSMVVAAVPEGLLPAMTIILAVGMYKLAHQQGLMRSMLATETLGAVSIICSDKTGTLTQGEMRVSSIVTMSQSPDSYTNVIKIGMLCNDAVINHEKADHNKSDTPILGTPTEKALILQGREAGREKKQLEKDQIRVASIPFESEHKYMVTRHQLQDGYIDYIKGAPENILPYIKYADDDGDILALSPSIQTYITQQYESLTKTGLRVLLVGYKQQANNKLTLTKTPLSDFVFLGLIALKDPLRPETKQSIEACQQAGIEVKIITGDHTLTTLAIAKDLGMSVHSENVLEGKDLDLMSNDELYKKVKMIQIFSRVEPKHKIRIVSALQYHGNIVAMTGDGINDAPALKKADIGIALGSGTDVAKETADLVLLNNNFHIIVQAVKCGRTTFDNIRKVVLYLLSNSFQELALISFSIIAGLPLALLPIQILWIKMIEDSLPSIALAFDPSNPDIMKHTPRKLHEPILNNAMHKLLRFVVIGYNILLCSMFYLSRTYSQNVVYAQTMAFASLGIASRFYIFSIRNISKPIFSYNIFENRWVNLTTLFGFLMVIVSIYTPFLNTILNTMPLGIHERFVLLGFGLSSIGVYELGKYFFIKKTTA